MKGIKSTIDGKINKEYSKLYNWYSRGKTYEEFIIRPIKKEKKPKFISRFSQMNKSDYRKDAWYRYKYGISLKDFETLYDNQDGKCKICDKILNKNKGHLDHCHKTMKIRGLLCITCNMGLGSFRDDKNLLQRAIKYLS